jgi:hypothetical protein
MKGFLFYNTMKKVPFDLDEYLMRFDQKYVFHNLDEELVSCSLMNEKVFQKSFYV